MSQAAQLVVNVTGEPLQPARIYYSVQDRAGVLRAFKKIRCVDHDPPKNRWVWLWEEEAKKLEFPKSYGSIPPKLHPIVIGAFTFRGSDQLMLDLRSFERVVHALPFFDQRIDRKFARATKLRVVNHLFSAADAPPPGQSMDPLFDRADFQFTGPQEFLDALKLIEDKTNDPEVRAMGLEALINQLKQRKTPEFEEMETTNFYKEGIKGLQLQLRLRSVEAMEHWQGITELQSYELIERLVRMMSR